MIDYDMVKGRFLLILPLAVAALFILLTYYKGQSVKIQPSFQTSSMHQLRLTHKEGDTIKWELSAGEAVFPLGGREVLLKSPGLKINRTPEIYLTGGSGIYEIEKGNVTLDNSVELNVKDVKFTTNTLRWDSADGSITTKDDVRFSGRSFLIEGTGLAAKTDQQHIRILKNVKATFYL
ncbi:MAG: LPS export ABC transporter periplasmic protein LptC [Nitrospiraceae bacterium]|nr:MAG: LPS export ABC transporter periplasmic protein LptC [Nitrospiraceae bacterium]